MNNLEQSKSCAIIVLGTYGSGSSAVAGILHHLGVMMGTKLVEATEANPKGHYEDIHFRELLYKYRDNKSYIIQLHSFIESRFQNFKIWGVKEPAILEAIMDIAPLLERFDYKIITTERDPMACARSYKRKWPESDVDIAFQHITNVLLEREKFIDKYSPDVYQVDFNQLTKDPEAGVNGMLKFVFGEKPSMLENRFWPSSDAILTAVSSIDPNMNHKLES